MEKRDKAVVVIEPAADHREKEGFFVLASGALPSDAAGIPLGVIVQGENTDGRDTVATAGFGGTVTVKLSASPGAVSLGTYLVLDGTTLGAAKADLGSGNRVRVARALEPGVAGELIEAYLVEPTALT
ncbi:MAG: hypothetical protein M5U15_13685 [Kiritimatiellae bacterium]|nr:hypothetical protein [Kiritimatiellia bacterium]